MKKQLRRVGKRIQKNQLHASEIGIVLALYNVAIIVAFALLVLVSASFLPAWLYLFIALPVLLTGFWLWFAQEMLDHYKKFSAHDAFLIAIIAAIPFFFLLLASAMGFAAHAINSTASIWGLVSYYGLIIGTSSVVLCITVVVFGLQHHFAAIKKKK